LRTSRSQTIIVAMSFLSPGPPAQAKCCGRPQHFLGPDPLNGSGATQGEADSGDAGAQSGTLEVGYLVLYYLTT
jgi:hypothetical protein